MNIVVRNIINQLKEKPKTLFLIDGIGALLTAFLLFVVLSRFEVYVGMSKTILTYLSLIALFFSIYSTGCFLFLKQYWTPFIRGIAIANLLYCLLTIGLLIGNRPFITRIGVSYFLVEVAIILILIYIELKVATAINQQSIHNNR